MRFLCLWNCRDDSNHFTVQELLPRVEHVVGRYSMLHIPLVDPKTVYLHPLHVKLGLMKNFAKAMDVNGNGFPYFQNRFCSEKNDAKPKAGVFIRPEIRHLIKDLDFKHH